MPSERRADLYLITPDWPDAARRTTGDGAVGAAGAANDVAGTGRVEGAPHLSHDVAHALVAPPASAPASAFASDFVSDCAPFLARLERALDSGVGLVQLRAKSLDGARFHALATAVRAVCRGRATVILNGPLAGDAVREDADDADGVHLSSARLMACRRRPVARARLVSAACHTLDELRQAARIGADFVTLSPVLPTRSHPGAAPLGWARFAELVAASPVPVYALGGMTRAHLAAAQACGARGIAAISGLW